MPRKDTGNNRIGESQDLDDQNQLDEGAYLINDQILALLTANSMYFHMFNQGTESNHLIVDEIRSFA